MAKRTRKPAAVPPAAGGSEIDPDGTYNVRLRRSATYKGQTYRPGMPYRMKGVVVAAMREAIDGAEVAT